MPPKKRAEFSGNDYIARPSGKSAETVTQPEQVEPLTGPPQQAEPSHQLQELRSAEDIVKNFYETGAGKDQEITMYKFVIKRPVRNFWADGELFAYSSFSSKWGTKIVVKFYILEDTSSEEATKISQKVADLLSTQSCTNVITPMFQVYDGDKKRVILCYPNFDRHLADWLESDTEQNILQIGGQNLLHSTWSNFIRDTLSCIKPIDNMAISKFGELSSYVCKGNCIKVILFPIATGKVGVPHILDQFAILLQNHIRSHLRHPELMCQLDSFVMFLNLWPEKPEGERQFWANLADHTLLQSYASISYLIATTWRPIDKLTTIQIKELKSNINGDSWQQVHITDDTMRKMFSGGAYSNDAHGFFTFIKKLVAHYTENYRKLQFDPEVQPNPVSLIKDTYHQVIASIYMLSKKGDWLE